MAVAEIHSRRRRMLRSVAKELIAGLRMSGKSAAARRDGDRWIERARRHHEDGDVARAQDCYQEARRRDPGHAEAHLGLGDVLR